MTSRQAIARTLAARRARARRGVGERRRGRVARMSFAAAPAGLSRGLTAGSVAMSERLYFRSRSPPAAGLSRPPPYSGSVQRLPLRTLVHGPARPDRVLFHGLWFGSHNNPRYAELLPRLERLDRVLILVSGRRPVRAVQYRALRAVRPARNRLLLGLASRRYRYLL